MSRTANPAADEFDAFLADRKRRTAQTFAVGDLVRLHDDVGTRAQQSVLFRVDRLPDPRAKRKADRMYGLTPAAGGQGLAAEAFMLKPATRAEHELAKRLAPAEKFTVGEVVVPLDGRVRGADPFTRLVVIAVSLKGLKLAPLGGSERGLYWTNVALNAVRKVTV